MQKEKPLKQAKQSQEQPLLEKEKLTPKQLKFIDLIVTKGDRMTATDCAIESGYSKKAARQIACNLQNPKMFPLVVREINDRREEVTKRYSVNYSRHVRRLDELSRGAEAAGNFPAAVAAEKSRGQAAGLYIDRKEIMHGSIDQMSKEEVEKKLIELRKKLSIPADTTELIEEKDNDETESQDKQEI